MLVLLILLVAGCIEEQEDSSEAVIQSRTAENGGLIPREVLFGPADKNNVQISPDGSIISYLAPVNGVFAIWTAPADEPDQASPVTGEVQRDISSYTWAYSNEHLLFIRDPLGDGNNRIYSLNLSSRKIVDLTPFKGTSAQIIATSPKFHQEIVVGLNARDPRYNDLYRMDIETGKISYLMENTQFDGFELDDDFTVRLAYKDAPDGGKELFRQTGNVWTPLFTIGNEDVPTNFFVGFNGSSQIAYLADSQGRDTSALCTLDLRTGKKDLIAENPKADFSACLIHPTKKIVQAAAFTYERKRWKILDESIADDLLYLTPLANGEVKILGRSLDDKIWLVGFLPDDGSTHYYYYNRTEGMARFLFSAKEDLVGQSLSRMIPVIIKSQDGLNLVSYYTLPLGSDIDGDNRPDKPLPMVLLVHDGPWERDIWGFSSIHQWLANRGYAVLSVNFRGSTGFGKSFIDAGNREWGHKMQDDLIDAVKWSVQQGIADPNKVAIMGEGYGGYAALMGLALTPDVFACGIDIMGPCDLASHLEGAADSQAEKEWYIERVGDFQTEEGRAFLKERSPLYYADQLRTPLLIAQGDKDPLVKKKATDELVQTLKGRSLEVTYALYSDEGHGFSRPENRLSFLAITEAFLAEHLGGKYQPLEEDLPRSSILVPVGAEEIPGLKSALQDRLQ